MTKAPSTISGDFAQGFLVEIKFVPPLLGTELRH